MKSPNSIRKSTFQLEDRRSVGGKLVSVMALLIAGAGVAVLSLVMLYHPDISMIVRVAALISLSICWTFLVAALVFLFWPENCWRVYVSIERLFMVLLVVVLAVLTVVVLWQALSRM